MARILDDLKLIAEKLDGDKWKLVKPLYYHVGSPDSKEIITVPKDFITDGASTPFGVRNLFPKDGTYTPISAIHDYMYSLKGVLPKKTYTRKECDQIFLEGMQVLNVPWWKRRIMYMAVRLAGWVKW